MLAQMCFASKDSGGDVVVVLTQVGFCKQVGWLSMAASH